MILARIQLQIQDFCWIFVHSGSSAKSLIFHDFKIQIRCHKEKHGRDVLLPVYQITDPEPYGQIRSLPKTWVSD